MNRLSPEACDRIVLCVIAVFLSLVVVISCNAQVVQRGDTFYCVKPNPTMTKYVYVDCDKKPYPIYMSANGKCFIIKTSKETGKPYRKPIKVNIKAKIQ